MTAIWVDIEKWLRVNAPDRAKELGEGVTTSQIHDAEAMIGRAFPADYAKSLAIHNGETSLSDYNYLSIESGLDNWARLSNQAQRGALPRRLLNFG